MGPLEQTKPDRHAVAPAGVRPGGVPPAGVPMDAYEYGLPEAAIAQEPIEPRSAARLLVGPGVDARAGSGGRDDEAGRPVRTVADLPELLEPGDLLVVNDTEVLAARLELAKATGGQAEVLLVEPVDDGTRWRAMVRPGRRVPPGTPLFLPGGRGDPVVVVGEECGPLEPGLRLVTLVDPDVVEEAGVVPLPPYIHRPIADPARYQTVYAAHLPLPDRSVAAPTAGLHFTPELLDRCRAAGAGVATVDLAIGLDTFRPVTAPSPDQHVIHTERYRVPRETLAACTGANRVVAVGTTAVRALESAAATGRLTGRTDLFVHGDFPFRVVDLLVTNFHLPRSSLLLLVESFCGPVWRTLYAEALAAGFRFLSFGDAMIVARARPKTAWADPASTR